MRSSAISLTLAAALALGCAESDSVPTSASPGGVEEVCQLPPEPQQTIPDSEFDLTITPNSASPGAKADLVIEAANDAPQTPEDLIATGAGALFQCWDGSNWINISQLLKNGFGPDNKPAAIDLSPGVTVTSLPWHP
jgi:hypothetical protein